MESRSAADRLRAAVAERGLLLVHDVTLPSVTTLLAGEPVRGSWWSHPRGTQIYNALQSLRDELATIKLLLGKQTLVAAEHWPDLVAIGLEHAPWQLDALTDDAHAALAVVAAADAPVTATRLGRATVERLERALLVVTDDVHTERGHHVKVVSTWSRWATEHGVTPTAEPAAARARLEAAVTPWQAAVGRRRLLPWLRR